MKEQVATALEAGATDNGLESIYDCALLLIDNIAEEVKSSLPAISDYIGASRGHDLPSTCILRLTDHATMVRDTGGPGVPILLLHALSMDSSVCREIYPPLSNNARVIMLRPGCTFGPERRSAGRDAPSIEVVDLFGTS